jgi:hypothetical protein
MVVPCVAGEIVRLNAATSSQLEVKDLPGDPA